MSLGFYIFNTYKGKLLKKKNLNVCYLLYSVFSRPDIAVSSVIQK